MEVIIPSRAAMDFDFNSARSSQSVTEPSTPRRFGDFYMSAPTSPTRMSEFYRDFEEFSNMSNWEDDEAASQAATPKSPKSPKREDDFGFDDFAFDVGEEVQRTSLSAEELFDGGVIRPFNKPPPTPSFFRQVLSPRRKRGKEYPTTQMDNTTRRSERISEQQQQQQRGRERTPAALSSPLSGRRATRSVSPLRVSEYQWVEEEKQNQQQQQQDNKQLAPKAMFTSCTDSKASRKWKLKDFLLFRSASEGRATDKDPFTKYLNLFRKNEDVKNSSFRSIDSPASVSISRRRGPPVSAHELHYTANKAVSNDMKKKTFLPYKQGILGRLAFNPAVSALANGFGSLSRK